MSESRHAGYALLLQKHQLALPEPQHRSRIHEDARPRRTRPDGFGVEESFPRSYWPGDTDFEHLVFALRYDGVDLLLLERIFAAMQLAELVAGIVGQPTSKYGRRLWFFYEWLTGRRLEIPDLQTGNYVPVLDPAKYFHTAGVARPRYRVLDNLLGDRRLCPMVRRTSALQDWASKGLDRRAAEVAKSVEPSLLARAIWYLSGKETKSSFAIEREEPGDRIERFVEQLGSLASLDLDDEAGLVELQNSIVDRRYADTGFRQPGDPEVYVGQTIGFRERIHYVCPRSAIVPELMSAWMNARAVEGEGGAVVEAAARSFGFVFIHPFSDGNGRVHRLLLHYVLARRGFLPGNLIVPISSAIEHEQVRYDQVLEEVSRRILPYVQYRLDEHGELTVKNEPDDHYRYLDLTSQCEATFAWLERAIEHDLVEELDFLRRYDEVRARMRAVVEMPDKKEQLFIKLCRGNGGTLSKRKRGLFGELDDLIISELERIVRETMSG
jgi:hypothetical protein